MIPRSPPREPLMTVTITPLTPVFAGKVGAIDLRQVHDRESLEAIRAGMDKYAVLVFRDQNFTNEEQLDFAQRFDGRQVWRRAGFRTRLGPSRSDAALVGAVCPL